eukprot:SAG11_NODE_2488_length_3295_cov_4.463079_4_plen_186_part_00
MRGSAHGVYARWACANRESQGRRLRAFGSAATTVAAATAAIAMRLLLLLHKSSLPRIENKSQHNPTPGTTKDGSEAGEQNVRAVCALISESRRLRHRAQVICSIGLSHLVQSGSTHPQRHLARAWREARRVPLLWTDNGNPCDRGTLIITIARRIMGHRVAHDPAPTGIQFISYRLSPTGIHRGR